MVGGVNSLLAYLTVPSINILKKMKKLCKKNVGVTLDQLEFYSSRARKITSQLKAILKEHHKNEDMVIFAVIGKFSVSPVGQFPIR